MANVSDRKFILNAEMLGAFSASAENGSYMALAGGTTTGVVDTALSSGINNANILSAINSAYAAASGNEPVGLSGAVQLAKGDGAFDGGGYLAYDGSQLGISGSVSASVEVMSVTGDFDNLEAGSAAIADLTSGRVVLAGTAGELEDNANLTFDGSALAIVGSLEASAGLTGSSVSVSAEVGADSLQLANNAIIGGTLGVVGESTLASATVSDLTSGRVVLAGTAGAIEDSANLTFDGSALAIVGSLEASAGLTGSSVSVSAEVGADSLQLANNAAIGGTLGVSGESTLASATISDLTSGRVVLAGTAGAIQDNANLTFDGSSLDIVGNISGSGEIMSVGGYKLIGTDTSGADRVFSLTVSGSVLLVTDVSAPA
jgi:hypothetical protein